MAKTDEHMHFIQMNIVRTGNWASHLCVSGMERAKAFADAQPLKQRKRMLTTGSTFPPAMTRFLPGTVGEPRQFPIPHEIC
jgi:hypothetical protein